MPAEPIPPASRSSGTSRLIALIASPPAVIVTRPATASRERSERPIESRSERVLDGRPGGAARRHGEPGGEREQREPDERERQSRPRPLGEQPGEPWAEERGDACERDHDRERAGAALDPRRVGQPAEPRRPGECEAEAEHDPAHDQREIVVREQPLRDAGDTAQERRPHGQPGRAEAVGGEPGRQRDRDDRERRGGEQNAGAGRIEAERILEVGCERNQLLPGDLADQDQGVEGEERAAHGPTVELRGTARLRSGTARRRGRATGRAPRPWPSSPAAGFPARR